MSRNVLAAIVGVLAMSVQLGAHRLDEYLQAARVALAREAIALEVDLTPGASVASDVIALVDRDRDGTVSPSEAEAYGQAVLADLAVTLDDRLVPMTLERVEIPTIEEMRAGLGTIQLRARGRIESIAAGRRQLRFRNHHRPGSSVYMVNALSPEDAGIMVTRQMRDPRQQEVRVEYSVGFGWPGQLLWLIAGAVGLLVLTRLRSGDIRWRATA